MTPLHDIELITFESIVAGGVERLTWLIETGPDWTVAGDVPGARVEQLDTPPGVVWRRKVVVSLAQGTRLMRVQSRPHRGPPRDPLAYLLAPRQEKGRETHRSGFVVGPGGALRRLPRP